MINTLPPKSEYREWRTGQINLPLTELIKEPNCGLICPPGRSFSCGCDECAQHKGHYKEGEKEKRFATDEIKMIEELFNLQTGFLRSDGCVLLRKWMSVACLRSMCNYYKIPKP